MKNGESIQENIPVLTTDFTAAILMFLYCARNTVCRDRTVSGDLSLICRMQASKANTHILYHLMAIIFAKIRTTFSGQKP